MNELPFKSALELAAMIRDRQISSVALTQLFIDRIEQHDGAINAVVVRTFDRALADAARADQALADGHILGPLHGVPMTIKESYVIKDTPATWGLPEWKDNIAAADGLAVQRFRAAGAHFLGKTNVPRELADFQSYNDIYGTTGNPFDTARTPGGSSGGSAAALAAGFCGLEAGSDIGGSIRNPAHFCGIYGHKPTYGIVPMAGHELMAGIPDIDLGVCGPLARSAADLHVALDIMAGPLPREATAWTLTLPQADLQSLQGLRVALWPNDELAVVADEVVQRVHEVADVLRRLGATVSDTARPDMNPAQAQENYLTLLAAVMTFHMPEEAIATAQQAVQQLDPHDHSAAAVRLRSSVLSHRQWLHANTEREKLRRTWDAFFKDWDILVCPQMATVAFPHDHRRFGERTLLVDNTERPFFEQIFWAGLAVNAYLPSTVFPTGLSQHGLPVGLQAIAAPGRDHRCIEFARLLTQHIGGFVPPPQLLD